ncbi:hypothetical protein ACFE04_028524 [Oxalis oulophora]
MESLAVPSLTSSSFNLSRKTQQYTKPTNKTCYITNYSSTSLSYATPSFKSNVMIKMQAVEEDFDLKQSRDMAAAKKRWDSMLRDGKVKILTPTEAGYAMQLSNKPMLDVRPSIERKKSWVKGSTWVPIFEVDDKFDPRKEVGGVVCLHYPMISTFWISYNLPQLIAGVRIYLTVRAINHCLNFLKREFLSKVQEKFPKDAEIIIACQKGLRSLAACEILSRFGYENLFWVQGGLESAEEEDLVREGPEPLKLAGIGGFSEFLGWTDQQRAQASKEGLGYRLVFTARLFGVIVAADALFLGAQQLGPYLQALRSH